MDRSTGAEELLDGPLDDRIALIGNLRDLARVNRRLGGIDLSARAIDALAPGRSPIDVLDVGTGGADIPLALIERGRASGRLVRVTAIDNRPEVLEAAAQADQRVALARELALRLADGGALPFPDGAFDVAHASSRMPSGGRWPRWRGSPVSASCSTTSSGVAPRGSARGRCRISRHAIGSPGMTHRCPSGARIRSPS